MDVPVLTDQCAGTECSRHDLPGAMDDRDGWWERVREICADSVTWLHTDKHNFVFDIFPQAICSDLVLTKKKFILHVVNWQIIFVLKLHFFFFFFFFFNKFPFKDVIALVWDKS